ncbi:uncharacterized protein TOT_020000004 [Theileria orientalis strain Shintoku]|uniref:Uncharacterized protein n=1 Tax=Theileria orientalis strain Shintoku TaxID=869250 RepID=J4C331_THEOR|nr:uncharacterized protein TOT_020000004 [Theileria orientalis strain Shintoku]BAM39731.1 uncharacterized protein TOT_020000004 [Theileria orientalis strain Shintoku]|eukprot:XP_009690032.1 uncharacterized protein TOT_020000004 [Theileria orientalis strain Shintoku]
MKIDTIGTCILVYLLTCVRFNVLVKVNAVASQPATTSPIYSPQRPKKDGVDLNLKSDTKSGKNFEYKKEGNYVTYTSKGDKAFKLVKDDSTEIWKSSQDSDYSVKVELDLLNNEAKAVTIHLPGNKTKVFKKDGLDQHWKEIDISKFNFESFYIDYEHESYISKNKLENNVRTFTSKKGFAFNGAVEYIDGNRVDIWKAKNDNDYANKIEVDYMNNDSKAVTLYFPGNKTKLYMKHNKNDQWTEVDITNVIHKTVSIKDDKETYFYSNKFRDSTRTFEAKTGFAFNKVKDGDTNIWTTTDDSEFANKVIYDKRYDDKLDVTINLNNGMRKLYIKKKSNEPWEEINLTKVNPKFVNIDYDHETYSYKHELDKNIRTFTAKNCFAFEGVIEYIEDNRVDIWKAKNDSEYANKIEVDLMNKDSKATKLFKKDGKKNPWTEIDTTELNRMTLNIQHQNHSYFYTNLFHNYVRTFEARKGFVFNFVKDGNTDLWTTSNENEYAKKVVTDEDNKVTIYIGDDGIVKVFNKNDNGKWSEEHLGDSQSVKKAFETQSSSSVPKTSASITGVDLNLKSDTKSGKNFEYKKEGNYVTYTSKGDKAFKLVKDDSTEIWKSSQDSDYSVKVEVDYINNDSKAVTLYFHGNKTKLFMKHSKNDPWTEIDITKVNTKSINIDYPHDSYFFTNNESKNVRTFIPKSGFIFNCALEYLNEHKIEIWTTNDENEYAKKVEYAKRNSGIADLTIYKVNGKKQLFIKEYATYSWKQVDITKVNPKSIDIDHDHECYFYKNELTGNFRTFTSKTGFAFNCANEYVDGNMIEVWKTDKENDYANKIEVDLMNKNTKVVTIYMPENKTKLFKKDGKKNPWTEIDTTELNRMTLNIQHQNHSYFYTNLFHNYVRTFEARKGFVFNFVKDGNTDLWTTSNENEYAKKVVSAKRSYGIFDLTIHMINGKNKLFIKEKDNDPWKEIDLTVINPKSMNIKYPYHSYFYTNILDDEVRTFEARNGFAFNVVNEYIGNNRVEIWSTSNENEYAKKVVTDEDNKVTIYIGDDGIVKVFNKNDNGKWSEEHLGDSQSVKKAFETQSSSSVPKTSASITGVDLNLKSDTQSTDKFEFTKEGNFVIYTNKGDTAFKLVKDDSTEIWKTDKTTDYSCRVEVDVMKNDAKAVTIYMPNDKTKLFKKDGMNQPWKEIDISKVTPKSVNIDYEHESHFYSNKSDNNIRTFTAKRGFAFNCANEYVDGNMIEVWKTDKENEFANKIDVNIMKNEDKTVSVYIDNNKTKVFKKDRNTNDWKEIDITKVNPIAVDIDYDQESLYYKNNLNNNLRTFTAKTYNRVDIWKAKNDNDYANKIEVDYINNDSKAVTLYFHGNKTKLFMKHNKNDQWTEVDLNNVTPKSVNIDYEHETHCYKNKLHGFCRTFTPKTGFAFNVVNEYINNNSIEIWSTTNESEYGKKVEVDIMKNGAKAVTIYMPDDKTKLFKKDGMNQSWNEIDTTKVNPMSVNIQHSSDTYFYTNMFHNDIRTFTSKTGFAFNLVNEYINNNNVEIWTTNQESEYSNKVVSAKRSYGILDLSIHMNNGKKKLFIKESEDQGWKEIDITKVNPRSMNINDRYHSYFYTNRFDNGVRTFISKTAFAFNVVKDGDNNIWSTSNENEYSKKVVTKDDKVTIYTGEDINAKTKVFVKEDNGNWTEDTTAATTVPYQGSSFAQVKLFKSNPSDPSNPSELDANDFSSSTSGSIVSFKIADGVNCVQLIYNNVLLWLYDSSQYGGRYPKLLYHNTETDILLLMFEGLDMTFEKNDQGQWLFTESGPLTVRFYVIDPNDNTKTVELPSTHYTTTDSGDITTFNIADNVDTIALTYGQVLLWQHDPELHGDIYPKSLYCIKSTETIVLQFVGLDISFAKNDQDQWVYTEIDTSADGSATTQPRVKLLKSNPSDPSNPSELGANDFSSSTSGSVVSYHIADGVNCVQLIFDDVLLWAYDSSQYGGRYPKSLYHNTETDILLLRFESIDLTFVKNDQGQWLFTESGPLAVKFHIVDPNDNTKTVELPSTHYTTTDSGDITTFNIADNVDTIALTYGQVLLWQHDANKHSGMHPKSLVFTKSAETMVLQFESLDISFAKNDQGQWEYTEHTSDSEAATTQPESGGSTEPVEGVSTTPTPESSGEGTPATPPAQTGSSTTQPRVRLLKSNPSDPSNPSELGANDFSSSTSGSVVSYHIADGVNCVQLIFDDVLLWAYDSSQYGGRYPKSLYHNTETDILLLRFESIDLTFVKNDQGQWLFTESGPLAVKFHIVDPNDNTKTVELPSTHYTTTDSGDITTFNIADNVDTIALTYGQVLLWQHDANKHSGMHPKSLVFTKSAETMVLQFESLDISFAKNDQGQWEYTETIVSGQ